MIWFLTRLIWTLVEWSGGSCATQALAVDLNKEQQIILYIRCIVGLLNLANVWVSLFNFLIWGGAIFWMLFA